MEDRYEAIFYTKDSNLLLIRRSKLVGPDPNFPSYIPALTSILPYREAPLLISHSSLNTCNFLPSSCCWSQSAHLLPKFGEVCIQSTLFFSSQPWPRSLQREAPLLISHSLLNTCKLRHLLAADLGLLTRFPNSAKYAFRSHFCLLPALTSILTERLRSSSFISSLLNTCNLRHLLAVDLILLTCFPSSARYACKSHFFSHLSAYLICTSCLVSMCVRFVEDMVILAHVGSWVLKSTGPYNLLLRFIRIRAL